MARLDRLSPIDREHLPKLPCPTFEKTPWTTCPPLDGLRLALVSTAGLHRKEDRPFLLGAVDYRIIPEDTPADRLVMSHASTNFDRTGFQQDWNVVFPIDRLRELVEEKVIGSLAEYHYSFMGATDPVPMEPTARELARIMMKDGVEAILLMPV
jgi:D-proline reductase (dithiol) PrdB